MTTDVEATGLLSFSLVIFGVFGMGIMVKHLNQEGTLHSSINPMISWSTQVFFRQAGET